MYFAGAFGRSSQAGTPGAPGLASQFNGLSVNERATPAAWQDLSESDSALARKLQEEWDQEEANQSGGNFFPQFLCFVRALFCVGLDPKIQT